MKSILQIIFRNQVYLTKGKGISILDKLKLKAQARYKSTEIKFFGTPFYISDASSFVSMYEEIFIKKIYEFKSISSQPLIIDCGSNIGVSILYFKRLYPNAEIIGFEPDPTIFKLLKSNIENQELDKVDLRQQAVWKNSEPLIFQSQGGLSGHISQEGEFNNVTKIDAFRLKDLLESKAAIDFLKIDIEGAEYEVLKDCKDVLRSVKNIFVEYHSLEKENQKLDEVLKILSDSGFRYHIQEAFTSSQPYMHVNTMCEMDLQLNIFGFRN
ncbi:FkbM family methyltransferase [Sporocytophaga myxococcoides]|uniref:FkbM family methyltransferase n=1 Tax=Sporocytophaga myxococcoides TaxID=153721 RepID=A0A098L8V5_9BACT|nr:FkbM family methyltransferase [Sporocytophaga myxococcoides]GAL83271.1 FkbM family methyltransferase [Sporocytophaga myxococcoides]